MSIKPTTIPPKTLQQAILSTGVSFNLSDIKGWNGVNLTPSEFGTLAFGSFLSPDRKLLELFSFDPSTVANASISFVARGLDLTGVNASVAANKLSWPAGTTVMLGTDTPQFLTLLAGLGNANTFTNTNLFLLLPTSNGGNATTATQLVTYAQLVAVATGSASIDRVVVAGTAGETVVAGEAVYMDSSDGEWKKTDATTASTVNNVIKGIAQGDGTDGVEITNGVLIAGLDTNQSGLTPGAVQYFSDTDGEFSESAGTVEVTAGQAHSATKILFQPSFNQQITENEQDALVGTSGTPSATNKFETKNDTTSGSSIIATTIAFVASTKTITDSGNGFVTAGFLVGESIIITGTASNNGTFTLIAVAAGVLTVSEVLVDEVAGASMTIISAVANKLVRLLPNGKMPGFNGENLINVAKSQTTLEADGVIKAFDSVIPSGENIIKRLSPEADVLSAITTAPTSLGGVKSLPLSTNGRYIYFVGGDTGDALDLQAQVRTMNSAENDFSNGVEKDIYVTDAGVNHYDVAMIGVDKFIVIYQIVSNGGIAAIIGTVSGTTITLGSAQGIEAAGLSAIRTCSVAKLDTDKAIIVYRDDSGGDVKMQVLSVSGVVISTNAPVTLELGTTNIYVDVCQLDTNKALAIYSTSSSSQLYAETINVSGTVPAGGGSTSLALGVSSWDNIGIIKISTTKALILYSQSSTPVNDSAIIVSIATDTITKGSALSLTATRITPNFGMAIISETRALVSSLSSATQVTQHLLDISGTTPTSITSESYAISNSFGVNDSVAISRVKPWLYVIDQTRTEGRKIITLERTNESKLIGITNADIADEADGTVLYRYNEQQPTGIVLTPGSLYYINDDGQPTLDSSLVAPILGVAISATKILLK